MTETPLPTPHKPEDFDYHSVAREAGVTDEHLDDIARISEPIIRMT